jgi:hypothetical protein
MDYAAAAQRAKDMLDRNGGPAILTLLENGDYDPGTGTINQQAITSDCTAVRTSYSFKEVDGKNILQGDFKLVVAGVDLNEGECEIAVQFGGDKFRAINVKPVSPDGVTVILYFLQCRY